MGGKKVRWCLFMCIVCIFKGQMCILVRACIHFFLWKLMKVRKEVMNVDCLEWVAIGGALKE